MSREIKFRGKWIDSEEWLYGDLINGITNDAYIQNLQGGGYNGPIEVRLDTVGQYTGLKDKNGVEIYEGDIVEYQFTEPDDPEKMEVVFDEKKASFGLRSCGESTIWSVNQYDISVRSAVIGNIHQNPELLTKAK